MLVVPPVNQNGGHANENGHVVQKTEDNVSPPANQRQTSENCDGKKNVEAEESNSNSVVEKQASSVTEERMRQPSGGNSETAADQKDPAFQEDGYGTAVVEQEDVVISDSKSAVAVSDEGAVRPSERPDTIDIAPDASTPVKSPGEDNPAFEATSP